MIQNVGGSRRFVIENVDPPDQFLRKFIPEGQIINPPVATVGKNSDPTAHTGSDGGVVVELVNPLV